MNSGEWRNIQEILCGSEGGNISREGGTKRTKISEGVDPKDGRHLREWIRRNEAVSVIGVIMRDVKHIQLSSMKFAARINNCIIAIQLHRIYLTNNSNQIKYLFTQYSTYGMTLSRWLCRRNVSFARMTFLRHFYCKHMLYFVVLRKKTIQHCMAKPGMYSVFMFWMMYSLQREKKIAKWSCPEYMYYV